MIYVWYMYVYIVIPSGTGTRGSRSSASSASRSPAAHRYAIRATWSWPHDCIAMLCFMLLWYRVADRHYTRHMNRLAILKSTGNHKHNTHTNWTSKRSHTHTQSWQYLNTVNRYSQTNSKLQCITNTWHSPKDLSFAKSYVIICWTSKNVPRRVGRHLSKPSQRSCFVSNICS